MKILIPMSGLGARFAQAGYTFPKPLIDVNGKPMIQRVVENIWYPGADYIFVVQQEHCKKFALEGTLKRIVPSTSIAHIVQLSTITEGAAISALKAEHLINNNDQLLIANSDQIVHSNWNNFNLFRKLVSKTPCGIILVFNSIHPKWSFVRLDQEMVVEVAEKRPISDIATVGIYYYSAGSIFVDSVYSMVHKNRRTNSEFYIAPTYNEMVERDIPVYPFYVDKMFGLGDPESLESFISSEI